MSIARILIVEDEPLVGLELQETLMNSGYEVPCIIDNADELMKVVRSVQPDLVLLDVRLKSYIDGIDAAKRLRMISDVPIIYLTAYSTVDTKKRAENTQPAAFLAKPIDEKLLLDQIRLVLESRRMASTS